MTVGLLSIANASYQGFVASRARMLQTIDAANNQIMARTALVAAEALTSIRLAVSNFTPANPDVGPGASVTETWSIEYPSGTIAAQVTFSSGATSITLANISAAISDAVTVSIPAGATFWARCYSTGASGILYNSWQGTGLGEQCAVAVSGLTDQTMSGASITGGSAQTFTHPPMAVIGRTLNPSVLVIGDSRTQTVNPFLETNKNGQSQNVCLSLGSVPFVNLAIGGATAQHWSTDASARGILYPYASQVIVALGINDVGSRTAAQIATSIGGILASCTAKKKYVCTIEPHTSSTDIWATTGNQTPNADNTVRTAYNDLVRAGISGAGGFYESADVAETSRNSGIWIASPTPPYTADGLHGNQTFYTLLAASGAVVPAGYP